MGMNVEDLRHESVSWPKRAQLYEFIELTMKLPQCASYTHACAIPHIPNKMY